MSVLASVSREFVFLDGMNTDGVCQRSGKLERGTRGPRAGSLVLVILVVLQSFLDIFQGLRS